MGKQTGRDVRGGSKKLLRVAGPPAGSALFAVAPERVERLFFEARMKPYISAFCAELARRRLPYRLVDAEELERIAGAVMHGGIVAVAQPRPVPVLDATKCAQWAARSGLLLLLDGVGNPHNLGAIARTAAFLGIERMILSNHPAQAGRSDSSYRVAEGGLEHVELYRARHFARALMELRPHYRVIGAAAERGQPLAALRSDERPIALVLGNEEQGLPAATLKACEELVTLSGSGPVP
jgi:RNA methyltransferase, TrmH family